MGARHLPEMPEGAVGSAIEYSYAGMIGRAMAVVFEPIGFNWQICVSLIRGWRRAKSRSARWAPCMRCRAGKDEIAEALGGLISADWSPGHRTRHARLVCLCAAVPGDAGRDQARNGSWKMPLISAGYLFALAYVAAFVTYRVALAFGA